jgi:hypothetical protein
LLNKKYNAVRYELDFTHATSDVKPSLDKFYERGPNSLGNLAKFG